MESNTSAVPEMRRVVPQCSLPTTSHKRENRMARAFATRPSCPRSTEYLAEDAQSAARSNARSRLVVAPATCQRAADRLALIEFASARADPHPLNTGIAHGSVGCLYRLPHRRPVDHDRHRAVDRLVLFADDQPADIARALLLDVRDSLEGGRPYHRAKGGE